MNHKAILALAIGLAVSNVNAGIEEDIASGVALDQLLQNAIDSGVTIDQAVGRAVSASPDRAGDIVAAAVSGLGGLSTGACGIEEPTTYTLSDARRDQSVDDDVLGLVASRFFQDRERLAHEDEEVQDDLIEPDALVTVDELAERVPADAPINQAEVARLQSRLEAGEVVEPVRITLYRQGERVILDQRTVDYLAAVRAVNGDRVPVRFDYVDDEAIEACIEGISTAAIEAGADPGVVLAATAAGNAGGGTGNEPVLVAEEETPVAEVVDQSIVPTDGSGGGNAASPS